MSFASDLELKGLQALAARVPAEELKCDILKYPHHGKDPMPRAFFEKVQPRLVLVTAYYSGRKGEVNIASNGWPALYTFDGIWQCTSDGLNWEVRDLRKQ